MNGLIPEVQVQATWKKNAMGPRCETGNINWMVATQRFCEFFTPKIGEDSHFDKYFSSWNHQLVNDRMMNE